MPRGKQNPYGDGRTTDIQVNWTANGAVDENGFLLDTPVKVDFEIHFEEFGDNVEHILCIRRQGSGFTVVALGGVSDETFEQYRLKILEEGNG